MPPYTPHGHGDSRRVQRSRAPRHFDPPPQCRRRRSPDPPETHGNATALRRVSERLDAYAAGFVLGPRVNAGGRVGEASLGARLLATDDAAEAAAIARRLDAFNSERRDIEARVLAAAIEQPDHVTKLA